MSSKAVLRSNLKNLRKQLTLTEITEWSRQIYTNLSTLAEFNAAKQIGIYFPIQNEVNIIEALLGHQDKQFYLPVLQSNLSLKFYHYTKDSPMQINHFNIQEPIPSTSNYIPIDS